MAKQRIIGRGTCPKCSGITELIQIESQPFPEEEQSKVIEKCTKCNFEAEKDFDSSNATTAFDHHNINH